MGKFAAHIDARATTTTCKTSENLTELLYVPYRSIVQLSVPKRDASSGGGDDETMGDASNKFRDLWRTALRISEENFCSNWKSLNWVLLDAVLVGDSYGPDNVAMTTNMEAVIEEYTKKTDNDTAVAFLMDCKSLCNCADINGEALLRLVRKFDKRARAAAIAGGKPPPKTGMARELLPELYGSSFFHATNSVTLGKNINLLRHNLQIYDDEEETPASKEKRKVFSSADSETIKEEEYIWFQESIKNLEKKNKPLLEGLVGHRGFHNINDNSISRPIENSLQAFEYAWASGVSLVECDVGATKDEKIIMAHDKTFERLALLTGSEASLVSVNDLTLQEIMRIPLKHGSRPPLLVDTLRSALAIGDHAKMVIEIKPGNSEIISPLMQLFQRHPALLSKVAVIMSFDAYVIQELVQDFHLSSMMVVGGAGVRQKSATNLDIIAEDDVDGSGSDSLARFGRTNNNFMKRRATKFIRPQARALQSVSYGGTFDATSVERPKLLVLTRHVQEKDFIKTTVRDGFASLDKKLPLREDDDDDADVDGVYLEYEPEMLEPEGKKHLLELSKKRIVGVWMLMPRDPDAESVCRILREECGVSYINTDFPRDFFTS